MKRRGNYMTFTETVDVHIEFDEILKELSNDDLRSMCDDRGIGYRDTPSAEAWRDFADDLRAATGDRLHLEVLIIRMLTMAGVPRMSIPKKEPAKA